MSDSRKKIIVILHDLRSAQNVGAIFRSADGAGVSKIYLTGYTPDPVDQFGRANGKIAKTALGAEQTIPWEHRRSFPLLARKLKKEGVSIIAIEQSPSSTPYLQWKPYFPVALVFGNEVEGLSPSTLRACDEIVEIPMRGTKESLNVSVAAGVLFFKAAEF